MQPDTFIQRWQGSGGAERANYVSFLTDLSRLLGVPEPEPTRPDEAQNAYVFEKTVHDQHDDGTSTVRRIDLYKRGCFILEAKQGVEQEAQQEEVLLQKPRKKGHGTRGTGGWDTFMRRAREQAERYTRLLPPEDGRPPFLLIVDVGHAIEVFAEFTRSGGAYRPFPDARTHRIMLGDLRDPDVRERLCAIWTDPLSLDPSTRSVAVTTQVALTLATLSRSLEAQGHTPERISAFLTRMIFTMFAEDVGLIEGYRFRKTLEGLRGRLEAFVPTVEELWRTMATGGYSVALGDRVRHFNGGLFEGVEVLPVTEAGLALFIGAASHDWSQVEPSIFGTLVERALNPKERHKLGAHYTPRRYVERLVNQTIIAPLREDWRTVQVQVQATLDKGEGSASAQKKARRLVEAFLGQLMHTRVLDPACGTGNFLYVSMELLKALDAEVVEALVGLGGTAPLIGVNPEQFLGIEVNPRAASVAELVLWIGYLQLYAREHGKASPPEPILRAFHNIENRDAVLAYEGTRPRVDADGRPVTRWDGVSAMKHPVTGQDVPDPSGVRADLEYQGSREASWPEADFIVGNPPFIGAGPMRFALGDGYTETLRRTYPEVPDSADFVMFWWFMAARRLLTSGCRLRRFGFVTTNSLRQTFNRRVIENAMQGGLGLTYAIPDHPWVDEADGAAVRVAMTVGIRGREPGVLDRVVRETSTGHGQYAVVTVSEVGLIHPDLTVGANVTEAQALRAMQGVSSPGVKLHGAGFIVPRQTTRDPRTGVKAPDAADLGLGRRAGLERHLRAYRNGKDLTSRPRDVLVLDLFGLEAGEVQERFPEAYGHVLTHVKPERDVKADTKDGAGYARLWWWFGKPRQELRKALAGLPRYVATVETSKHRFFTFLDASVLPDNMLIAIATDDAYHLGVLQSRVHVAWALAQGGRLGIGNDPRYNKSRCFETFPFPDATADQQARIRDLAERLDALRKARLAEHPNLTMTGMYNVLERVRAGDALDAKERAIHDQGLVAVMKALHDALDAAVLDAYGWPADLPEQEVLVRLATLNAERVQEEKRGLVRYLRPAYQDPKGRVQENLGIAVQAVPVIQQTLPTFPTGLPAQVQAVRGVLASAGRPLLAEEVAEHFRGARVDVVAEIMETLVLLGQAQLSAGEGGEVRYAA
jgi:hypothetical protein